MRSTLTHVVLYLTKHYVIKLFGDYDLSILGSLDEKQKTKTQHNIGYTRRKTENKNPTQYWVH
jgi:hypothetical protein